MSEETDLGAAAGRARKAVERWRRSFPEAKASRAHWVEELVALAARADAAPKTGGSAGIAAPLEPAGEPGDAHVQATAAGRVPGQLGLGPARHHCARRLHRTGQQHQVPA